MLVLKDLWFVFESDPIPIDDWRNEIKTIYEVELVYNGITECGFEFKVCVDTYKNVPSSYKLTNNLYHSCDGVVRFVSPKRTIYLSQAEVEDLYKNNRRFYENFIMASETCYVQTIVSGGAGSEHI